MNNRFKSFGTGLVLACLMALPTSALSAPYAFVADSFQDWIAIIDLFDNSYSTVAVGTAPKDVVLHPSGAEVYVTNYTDSTLSFLDVSVPGSEYVYATIDEASILNPEGMTISADGNTLYIAHADPPTNPSFPFSWNTFLTEIDIASQTITRSQAFLINDAVTPSDVVLSPDESTIYISGRITDSVFVIGTDTLIPDQDFPLGIPVGGEPRGMAVSPDGARLFVTNELDGTVSVIATSTNTVVKTIPVGANPYDVVVTPNGLYAYVVNSGDDTVDVIDIANNYTVISETGYPIPVTGETTLATTPRKITTNLDGSYVYVSGYGDNTVTVIDTSDDTIADMVDLANGAEAGGGMLGVAVAPDPFPWISPDKDAVTFAEQVVGGTLTQTITITNKGLADLTLGQLGSVVSLRDNFSFSNDNCSDAVLTYKEACTLTVNFTPVVGGPLYDSFNIPSNDADIIISMSGTGESQAGNSNPTAPSLKSPNVGTNSVDLTWVKSTDPDGDTVTYRVYISKETAFTDGFYYAVDGTGLLLAGSGLASLMLLAGALRKRSKILILIAVTLTALSALTACGGGGGGGGGGDDPIELIRTSITDLDSGTRYYWKVVADDGKGGYQESPVSSFLTL